MKISCVALMWLAGAAAALAAPQGRWVSNEAPDGVRVGLVVPEFSPNEFVGLMFACAPGAGKVVASVDVAPGLKPGESVEIVIRADDRRAVYRARGEKSEQDDAVRAVFETTLADPMLADVANARALVVAAGQARHSLPVLGADAALAAFLSKCRK